jgi:Uma2 family endonuclease
MQAVIERRTFTVDEYHQMAETGILTEDDRVELINGEIITMSPINSPHAGSVKRINALFTKLFAEEAIISVQDPLVVGDFSEPEPDIMLLKPQDDFYASAHPQASDVFLLIEVAASSVQIDRQVKLPVYASAGVPEVWIVNLPDHQIELYRSPMNNYYQAKEVAKGNQTITVPHFRLSITAQDLLGK